MPSAANRPPLPAKKRKVNLSAYEAHHVHAIETPRMQVDMASRLPVSKPTWERTLPGVIPARSNRKPLTIEDSLHLGYKKRLDMTGLQEVMRSDNNLHEESVGVIQTLTQGPSQGQFATAEEVAFHLAMSGSPKLASDSQYATLIQQR